MKTGQLDLSPNHRDCCGKQAIPWQAEKLLKQSWVVEQHGIEKKKWRNTARAREIQTRLGGVAVAQGHPQAAQECLKLAVELCFKACGSHHPETALAQCRMAANTADMQK